ncbi:T-lymphoma invasion and metastasis-inducing protein 2-like isoform X2 [Thalassophryne amazonica]|uniref:T-lymphoma invasion and metastasis-inducing protein 2-like isoform X2 n=1 Tax=Thalassophryne amazonica TaxID=390379 RepID=UPI001471170F|nr:T-lymphoma invasion and metastasis-inducing protein 2-like isoform X2 [Thalassophryne amazonica]
MGNTDSRHNSLISPAKSGSLQFPSRKRQVQSPRTWWRNKNDGCRSRGWSYQPHSTTGQLKVSWRHQHPVQDDAQYATTSQMYEAHGSRGNHFGFLDSGAVSSGIYSNGTSVASGGSPKVLLSKDGSMRVEFTKNRMVSAEPQCVPESSLWTSKGSSLSSEGSWYDSPWGNGGELADNVFSCRQTPGVSAADSSNRTEDPTSGNAFFTSQVKDVSPGFNASFLIPAADLNFGSSLMHGCKIFSLGQTEDSGIGDSVILPPDVKDFSLIPGPDVSLADGYTLPVFQTTQQRTFSSGLVDTYVQEDEGLGGGGDQLFSFHTLPCPKAESVASATRTSRKDFLKSRIRQLSDWTGSLSRKKRRIQEPWSSDAGTSFLTGLYSGLDGCGTLWASDLLHFQNQVPLCSSSRTLSPTSDAQRQNIYQNFMQELVMGGSSFAERTDPSEEDGEEEEEVEEEPHAVFEKEHDAVRRAGWLSFKALITIGKDRKVELVACRRWSRHWVTLKGCTLLFYETYGKSSGEHKLLPRYILLADDSIIQAFPEHPKKENVFCLSNAYGDVYLFQAGSQTDLENWVTAVHSASASRLARRHRRDDTLRLLGDRSRLLLHQIDLDAKMKKMAELQLSVITEQKKRRAVENQIQQWEQNLEKLNLDLFQVRCYLSSLQGSELPNPKSLLAVASRPSKSMLGRLGVFSVSSFHALVCSRDEAMLRRRGCSLSGGYRSRRGLPSSLKVLRKPCRRSSDNKLTQVCGGEPSAVSIFTVSVCRQDDIPDFGFTVTGHVDQRGKSHVFVSEVDPLGPSASKGLRAGDQVLAVNGVTVSGLDLDLLQNLFSLQELQLLLTRDESDPQELDPGELSLPLAPAHLLPACTAARMQADDEPSRPETDHLSSLSDTFPEGRAADNCPRKPCRQQAVSPSHLSVCQRLRKVIEELVDTEKSYVKDLLCLFDVYLTPLQTETFLSKDEMEALFGSLPDMLEFQRVFVQTLEETIAFCPNFSCLETPEEFKKVLVSLGGSFLYYADHFKLYSGFCANHTKVQKVLERAKTDVAFKQFLENRNPNKQHSSTLESYLIKPVQRVLKYPLLLKELVSLTDPDSPEHTHLTGALRAMEQVASHINEMQKIYEDYGSVFEQLAAEHSDPDKQVSEISMGEFLVHSSVAWLNPLPCMGRLREEPELTLFVFKRAIVLVYRETSKLKKRMTGSRSTDLDPFRFCWLIPVSAVQVRSVTITGSEDPCVWELVHSRSKVEGRPETVFQLCSSGLEAKASVVNALRCLRDGTRHKGTSAPQGGAGALRRQQQCCSNTQSTPRHVEGGTVLRGSCSEQLLPSHNTAEPEADCAGRRFRLCSLTADLEAQLQRLNVTEKEGAEHQGAERRSCSWRRSPGGEVAEVGSVLERDFSIQSMKSLINEDCFYDSVQGIQCDSANTNAAGAEKQKTLEADSRNT